MRLNSVRARTMLALVLICMAIVSVIGGLWLYTTSQNIKSYVYTTDLHDSLLLASYVDMYVDVIKSGVYVISIDPGAIYAERTQDVSRIKPGIDGLVNVTPQEDIALLIDKDGRLLYSTGAMAPGPPGQYIVDGSINSINVTGIYYSNFSRCYVFAVISPIKDNGSVLGYVCDEVRPDDIGSLLEKQKTGLIHHAVLVDNGGRAISRSNVAVAEEHANLSAYLPVQKVMMGEEGVISYRSPYDGRPRVSAYVPVSDVGWGIIVSTRTDISDRPLLYHLLYILGLLALFITAIAIFGYFASAYITRLIEKIGAEKDLSDFYIDLMSHDINNMNHSGMGFLELAVSSLKGRVPEGDIALIEKAYDALKNSSSLIDTVRKLKKAQTDLKEPEVIDLGQLIAQAVAKYAQVPGREVSINYTPGSCLIRAGDVFREVPANIIENSIKHSDPSKPLVINITLSPIKEKDRDYCLVSIEDNGPGVPDDMKEAIFGRFRRGATKTRGKGLGLYIVKMLVEGFGGKVWEEDRVKGDHTKGARFVIIIPSAGKQN